MSCFGFIAALNSEVDEVALLNCFSMAAKETIVLPLVTGLDLIQIPSRLGSIFISQVRHLSWKC